jgi:four helix bundle protein
MPNPFRLKVLDRARALHIDMHRVFRGVHVAVNPELKSQLLRAMATIPRNIAEGAGRATPTQYSTFLGYAIASSNEVQECLHDLDGLDVVPDEKLAAWLREIAEIRMMTYGLRKRVDPPPDAPPDS